MIQVEFRRLLLTMQSSFSGTSSVGDSTRDSTDGVMGARGIITASVSVEGSAELTSSRTQVRDLEGQGVAVTRVATEFMFLRPKMARAVAKNRI